MEQVIVKCVSNHMNKNLLTEGKNYKAYSHNNPCNPLTEREWLDLTQKDLLVIVADNGDKISFAKWRFIMVYDEVMIEEIIIEGAKFESTLGQIDELEDAFNESLELPKELVNHPSHYNRGKYEVIDVIEDWHLGFNLGNAIKYIGRCGHKDDPVQELEKAKWYIQREIDRIKKERN
jgi:hypothetical protein